MKLYTVYTDELEVSVVAEKVEFEWGSGTVLFLIGDAVVGASKNWDAVVSEDHHEGG